MSRPFARLMLAGIVIMAVGLSACGRRGPLEAPPAFAPVPVEHPAG